MVDYIAIDGAPREVRGVGERILDLFQILTLAIRRGLFFVLNITKRNDRDNRLLFVGWLSGQIPVVSLAR